MLTLNPTKVEGLTLQELLQITDSGASGELGSSDLQLLSLWLSQWKNVEYPVSVCISAVLPISHIRTAEESVVQPSFLDPFGGWTAVAGLSGVSKQHKEEDSLLQWGVAAGEGKGGLATPLLAVSQDYEKRCDPLITSDDVQSAVIYWGSFAFWAIWSSSCSVRASIFVGFGVSPCIPFKINAHGRIV